MPETVAERARRMILAVELDEDELACRILEAQTGMKRPPGMTGTEALDTQSPELRGQVRRAALAAVLYLQERVNRGGSVS